MQSKSGLVALLVVAGVAVAILFTALPGRYQIAASADRHYIWRMNTVNGSLSVCTIYSLYKMPICSQWGDALAVDPAAVAPLQKPLAAPLASPPLLAEPPLEEPPDLASGK